MILLLKLTCILSQAALRTQHHGKKKKGHVLAGVGLGAPGNMLLSILLLQGRYSLML